MKPLTKKEIARTIRAEKVVEGWRGANEGLDRWFDEVMRDARLSIGMDLP
jgi:hypothetical protein